MSGKRKTRGGTGHAGKVRSPETVAELTKLPGGGHRWRIRSEGGVAVASTSGSSVSMIHHISMDYGPALKRLAEEWAALSPDPGRCAVGARSGHGVRRTAGNSRPRPHRV